MSLIKKFDSDTHGLKTGWEKNANKYAEDKSMRILSFSLVNEGKSAYVLFEKIKYINTYKKSNTEQVYEKVLNWYAGENTGESSKFMCSNLLGIERDYAHPYDPSDFRRCLLLLKAVPELKLHLEKMRYCSDTWKNLIDHWDKLEKLLLSECIRKENYYFKSAPKTYAKMKELRCE